MFNRINISIIFKKHFETFYDYGELVANGKKKIPLADILLFLLFPLILSITIVLIGIRLTNDYINIIITSLSIFVGLLFNLLILIFDLAKKQKVKIKEYEQKNEIVPVLEKAKYSLVKELYANISFCIAISILSIIFSILPTLKPKAILELISNKSFYNYLKQMYIFLTNICAIFLSIEFLLTLSMILKRFFLIFDKDINESI